MKTYEEYEKGARPGRPFSNSTEWERAAVEAAHHGPLFEIGGARIANEEVG
ncbi:hypothetical protein [Nocardia farcinica]|uniref:hypothetical protein n=1 Tax=Nocardia farcinica TaxID=37329 RepID=UPI002459105B|nr:hypothetical protein [Nocardia farcinica]